MRTLFLVILAFCLALPAHAEQRLEFSFIDAPLSASSLAVLKAAYTKLGIVAEGRPLPPARGLAESDAGRTDSEVHRIKDVETNNDNLIRIEVPINQVEGLAITCGKSVDTSSPDSIRNHRIGIKLGTLYAERLTQGMPNVISRPHEDKLMELLRAGRLDIVIGDRPWALSLLRQKNNSCVVINDPPLVVVPLFHYLHRKHADLVPKITRVLRQMRKTGEMDAIRMRTIKALTEQ